MCHEARCALGLRLKNLSKERKKQMNTQQNLTVIDGETLIDKRLPPTRFCVESLIPQGLCILGGAPKVDRKSVV